MRPYHRTGACRSLFFSSLLAGLAAAPVLAQDVIKPASRPGTRLAGPKTVVATQQADGTIRVVWSKVPGATSYSVLRSAPPTPAQPIVPDPTDTVFIDTNVTAGTTYYYLVGGIGEDGGTGLKKGSAPIKAIGSSSGVATGQSSGAFGPPADVQGYVMRREVTLTWTFGGRQNLTFIIERIFPGSNSKQAWEEVGRTPTATRSEQPQANWTDYTVHGVADGTRIRYRVTSVDGVTGRRSSPTESNEIVFGASDGGATSGSSGAAASGTVSVSMVNVSVRAGGTSSLASSVTGTVSRWVSLDEGIATVDASGTATARSPGRAQIIAIGRASDASIRMTFLQVTVTP